MGFASKHEDDVEAVEQTREQQKNTAEEVAKREETPPPQDETPTQSTKTDRPN